MAAVQDLAESLYIVYTRFGHAFFKLQILRQMTNTDAVDAAKVIPTHLRARY